MTTLGGGIEPPESGLSVWPFLARRNASCPAGRSARRPEAEPAAVRPPLLGPGAECRQPAHALPPQLPTRLPRPASRHTTAPAGVPRSRRWRSPQTQLPVPMKTQPPNAPSPRPRPVNPLHSSPQPTPPTLHIPMPGRRRCRPSTPGPATGTAGPCSSG